MRVLFRAGYTLIMLCLVPIAVARLCWRNVWRRPVGASHVERLRERFGFAPRFSIDSEHPRFWLHAVSVGEVQAAVPLAKRLMERHPQATIVVTTTTLTGRLQLNRALGSHVSHCYFPFDLPWCIDVFLRRVAPTVGVIMETEIWPNLMHVANRHQLPMMLVNARLSQRSAAGYAKVMPLISDCLEKFTVIAAQGNDDAARFRRLGAAPERVTVTGSIKFDLTVSASLVESAQALRHLIGPQRSVWLAASTHDGEEQKLLDTFLLLRQRVPQAVLIIAPRHPERFDRVRQISQRVADRHELWMATRSDGHESFSTADIVVVDTMGELMLFYAAADVAFVGGSLVEVGGHNVLEPAAVGCPVVVGPHTFNFFEITNQLIAAGGARRVSGVQDLLGELESLLTEGNLRHDIGQRAKAFIARNRGAHERVINLIEASLPDERSDECTDERSGVSTTDNSGL